MCVYTSESIEEFARRDSTGRSKLEREAKPVPDELPAIRLAHYLNAAIGTYDGKPALKPSALRRVIAENWTKISALAHQIHNEETK